MVGYPAETSGQRGVAVYPSLARLGVDAQTTGVQVEMADHAGVGDPPREHRTRRTGTHASSYGAELVPALLPLVRGVANAVEFAPGATTREDGYGQGPSESRSSGRGRNPFLSPWDQILAGSLGDVRSAFMSG